MFLPRVRTREIIGQAGSDAAVLQWGGCQLASRG